MTETSGIWGNSINMMSKSLDYLWEKQKVTSNNIANAETPGFKAGRVSFEETFRKRLESAQAGSREQAARAISGSRFTVWTSPEESARVDGNNVNTDVEMVEMTRSALQYQYGISSINSDISRLGTAIKGQ